MISTIPVLTLSDLRLEYFARSDVQNQCASAIGGTAARPTSPHLSSPLTYNPLYAPLP